MTILGRSETYRKPATGGSSSLADLGRARMGCDGYVGVICKSGDTWFLRADTLAGSITLSEAGDTVFDSRWGWSSHVSGNGDYVVQAGFGEWYDIGLPSEHWEYDDDSISYYINIGSYGDFIWGINVGEVGIPNCST